MKNTKAYTFFDLAIFILLIAVIAFSLMPIFLTVHSHHQMKDQGIEFNVGDVICIPALSITGIVNKVDNDWFSYMDIIVNSTNGMPVELQKIDARLLQKVPPSPESEWKH